MHNAVTPNLTVGGKFHAVKPEGWTPHQINGQDWAPFGDLVYDARTFCGLHVMTCEDEGISFEEHQPESQCLNCLRSLGARHVRESIR